MSSKRSFSRSQVSRSKLPAQRAYTGMERISRGALFILLVFFLVLLVILLRGHISQGQSTLLGIVLLALVACVLGTWLPRLSRGYTSAQNSIEKEKRATRVPSPSQPIMVADLLRLTASEFEDFVGDLLEAIGQCTDVRRIGGAGDRGADLLAKDRFGRPFIVQCKRYSGRNVSASEMRDFLGAKGIYGADECMFVTTSRFTESARADMRHLQHTVFLIDGENLVQLVRENWRKLPGRWQQSILKRRANVG